MPQESTKSAAPAEVSYSMTGRLFLSESGWLLLSVPNAFVRGAFDALDEPGIELPRRDMDDPDSQLRAHISVMRPEEIEKIPGGADAITERGKTFGYTPGRLRSVKPDGWDGISRVWFIEARSPDLEKLRKTYGLSPQPKHPFHITVAVRKTKVLQENEVSKAASDEECCPHCKARLERGDDGFCNRCGEPWVEKSAAVAQWLDLERVEDDCGPESPALRKEAALGIPDRRNYGDLAKVKPGELLDLVIQEHSSRRAGLHNDVRVGRPDLGLLSWATRKEFPQDGKPIGMYRQPLHSYDYGNFEGPLSGYGSGTVRRKEKGQVLVTKVSPGSIHFTVANKKYPERYVLFKPPGAKKEHDWMLLNVTPKSPLAASKVHYDQLPAENVESRLADLQGAVVQPKIDGASALIQLGPKGLDIYSYRQGANGRPIVHTERVFGSRPDVSIPKHLHGSVLRGELYAQSGDKVLEPSELGGILNSTVANALAAKKARQIALRAGLFDVQQIGSKPLDHATTPYSERRRVLEEILPLLPKDQFHAMEQATTPEEAQALWQRIRDGQHPLTREGVIFHPPTGKPQKAKLLDENDVYITGIFPGEGKYKGRAAGGFTYSLEPGGKPVGRVGTGLDDNLRTDLFANEKDYIGRVARIRSQGQFPAGAYRSPALLAIHEDYGPVKQASDAADAEDADDSKPPQAMKLDEAGADRFHQDLKARLKQAAAPYWLQGIQAQLQAPAFDTSKPVLRNVLDNLLGARAHGANKLRQARSLLDWQSHMSPDVRMRRFQAALEGVDPVVSSPVDKMLFG